MKANIFKAIVEGAKEHAPVILTTVAIGAAIGAVATTIVRKPKYDSIIEEEKAEAAKNDEEISKKDIAKAAFKAYWPTLLLLAVSSGAAIGANVINAKRVSGALMTAATTKKLYDDYVEAAEKKLKPKQVQEVTDEIAKKRANESFASLKKGDKIKKQHGLSGGKDEEQLLYDSFLEKAFYGNPEEIRRKYVDFKDAYFNHGDDDVRLEWFYLECDIPHEKIPIIKKFGWKLGREMPEFKFVPIEIQEGPYAGQLVRALQWTSASMPEIID